MITRDNYEALFIDYLEGNLPENEIDQFLDFLNQNPDLKEELHRFEDVFLPEEHVVYNEKQKLHKSLADEALRLENKTIAYMEGDLEKNERKLFESYLETQPKLRKEYELFTKTKLVPDLSVKFAPKNKLYHKPIQTLVLNWVARAAAIVVLTWGIGSLFQTPNKPKIAQNKTEVIQTKPNANGPELATETKVISQATLRENKELAEKNETGKVSRKDDSIQEKTEIKQLVLPERVDETSIILAEISPINTRLETELDLHLAISQTNNITPINETPRVMSVEEFLALRAKKVGKEGLFSAQRIARLGLTIASEISGERIGYKEKDGKITSVEFESKLMAFSIPLEKR